MMNHTDRVLNFALHAVLSPALICQACGTHNRFHALGCPVGREELDSAVRSDREMGTGEMEFEAGDEE